MVGSEKKKKLNLQFTIKIAYSVISATWPASFVKKPAGDSYTTTRLFLIIKVEVAVTVDVSRRYIDSTAQITRWYLLYFDSACLSISYDLTLCVSSETIELQSDLFETTQNKLKSTPSKTHMQRTIVDLPLGYSRPVRACVRKAIRVAFVAMVEHTNVRSGLGVSKPHACTWPIVKNVDAVIDAHCTTSIFILRNIDNSSLLFSITLFLFTWN